MKTTRRAKRKAREWYVLLDSAGFVVRVRDRYQDANMDWLRLGAVDFVRIVKVREVLPRKRR